MILSLGGRIVTLLNQVAETVKEFITKEPPTPFVLRPGIEIIWPQNRPYQPKFLMTAVQKGYIRQRALNFTELVFRHRYISAVQARRIYFHGEDKIRTKARLKQMEDWGLINRIRFQRDGRELPLQVYVLDRGGAELLRMIFGRDMSSWRFEQNIRKYSYIMRILAANEIFQRFNDFSRLLQEHDQGDGVVGFEIEPTLVVSGKVLRYPPTAQFSFQRGEDSVTFLIEVIRGAEAFEYLPKKLSQLQEYYLAFPRALGNPPVTIFMGEREDQLLKVNEILQAFNLDQVRQFSRYTTDELFGKSPLQESLCKIIENRLEIAPFKKLLKPPGS